MACFLPLRPYCFADRRVYRFDWAFLPNKCEKPSSRVLQRHLGVSIILSPSSHSRLTSTVSHFKKTPRIGLLDLSAFPEQRTLQLSRNSFEPLSGGLYPSHRNSLSSGFGYPLEVTLPLSLGSLFQLPTLSGFAFQSLAPSQ